MHLLQNFHDTRYHSYSGKGYGVRGESNGQVAYLTHTERERTEWISQPPTSAKRQVAAEALVFHNAVRVSMISPCVWHERPYQLCQQILSRLWLITDRPQQVGASDIGRVNAKHLCPPLTLFLKDHENQPNSERAPNGSGLEEMSVWLFLRKSCECVHSMCLHLSWEHTEPNEPKRKLSFCWKNSTPCFTFPLARKSVWLCMCA